MRTNLLNGLSNVVKTGAGLAGCAWRQIGRMSGEGAIEHPLSTHSAPFGTRWKPAGEKGSTRVWKHVAMIFAVLVMSIANIGMAWGAETVLFSSFTNTTASNYFKSYTVDGKTVSVATSGSISSSSGDYYCGAMGSTPSNNNGNYVELTVTGATIKTVSVLITGNGENKTCQPALLGWEGAIASNTTADYVLVPASQVISNKGLSNAQWHQFDVHGNDLTRVRIYRAVKGVDVAGESTSKTTYGNAQTLQFYGIRVELESSSSTYTVTYNGNGKTSGSVPVDSDSPYEKDATVTVLGNSGALAKTGFIFNGWNTSDDGSGTHYDADDTFTMGTANVTLYAEWAYPATGTGTVTYALSGSTTTGTITGVSTINSLSSSFTTSTLSISSTKSGYTGDIVGTPSSFSSTAYLDVQFTIADGYQFNPSSITVQANPLNNTGALMAKVEILDGTTTVASNELSCAKSTDNTVTFASGAFTGKNFKGTTHLRIYFWGPASDKKFYVKSPLTITGTVAAAAAGCANYSFHYGTTKGSEDQMMCFSQVGSSTTYITEEWTIPSSDQWTFVGWQGSWHNDNAKSANLQLSSMRYGKDHSNTLGSISTNVMEGAKGYVQIYSDNNESNKYVGFVPSGYILRRGTDSDGWTSTAFIPDDADDVMEDEWTTPLTSFTADNADHFTYVGLKTASGYVWTNRSETRRPIFLKPNATWKNDNAKFVMYYWDDSSHSGYSAIMTDPDGDGVYEAWIPNTYSYNHVLFGRLNPVQVDPVVNWDNKWNQTTNQDLPSDKNLFEITGGSDQAFTGSWSVYGSKGKFHIWSSSNTNNWYCQYYPHYVLTYDANGGSGEPSAQSVPVGGTSSERTVEVAAGSGMTPPTGYTFAGWNPDEDDADAGTIDGDYDPSDNVTLSADMTLYAVWSPKEYTITLDDESATTAVSPSSVTATYNSSTIASITNPSKTGYTFGGWYSGDDGTGTLIIDTNGDLQASTAYTGAGGIWTNDGDVTLHAKWTANTYDVTHTFSNVSRTSGGSGGTNAATYGTDYSVTVAASSNYILPDAITVTIGGSTKTKGTEYTWSSGTVTVKGAYILGAIVITITGVPVYSVTYNLNGGEYNGSSTAPTQAAVTSGTSITLPSLTPTKDGYVFASWKCSVGNTYHWESYSYTMTAANTTFTAQWVAAASMESGTLYTVDDIKPLSVNAALSSTGQYAKGISSNGIFTSIGNPLQTSDTDGTFEFKTEKKQTVDEIDFTKHMWFKGASNVTSNVPTSRGLKFSVASAGTLSVYCTRGDRISLSDGTNSPVALTTNTSGNIIRRDVTISDAGTYYLLSTNSSNGIAGMKFVEASCDDPSASLDNGAYTIGGSALDLRTLWSSSNTTDDVTFTVTNVNGTGATIAGDGYSFSATTAGTATISASQTSTGDYCDAAETATITVSNPTYTVTYNKNGATSGTAPSDGSSPYSSGSTVTVLGNTGSLAKTGNVFLGWSDGVNAYAPGETFTISANTTLSPIWKEGTSATVTYTMAVGADYTWSASGSSNETTGIPNAGVTITETYAGIDSGKGHKKGSTAKLAIQTTAQGATYENPTNYILYNFSVASGYAFTPSDITIKIANVGAASANNIKYKAVLSDGSSHSISTTYICTTQDATIETFHLYNEEGVTFDGSVSLKLWAWTITDKSDGGSAYRLGTPLTIAGVTESTATLYDISTSATNGTIAVTVGGASASSAEVDATVTITATPSDGYEFTSWSVTKDAGGNVTVTSATTSPTTFTMPAEDVTVSATFTEITHTVSVSAGAHGTVSPSSVSGVGIATASGNITATPSTGYNFSSWDLPSGVTAAAGKTASSNPIQINATADDKTITAQWSPISYTITYNLNSGSLDGSQKTSYNIETDDYDLPTPTRDGYVFQGWYTDEDFTSDRVYTLAEGSTGDKTYYAKWADDLTINWTITKVSSKLYKGGTGYTVTAEINDASWDASGDKDDLVLSASDGVTLSNITKSINGSDKAQVSANFSVAGDVEGDKIYFTLSVPAAGDYSAIDDEKEVELDECPSGGTTVTLTEFGKQYYTSGPRYGYAYAGSISGTKYVIQSNNSNNQKIADKDSTAIRLNYSNTYIKVLGPGATTSLADSLFTGVSKISFKWKLYNAGSPAPTATIDVYVGSKKVASAISVSGGKSDPFVAIDDIIVSPALNGAVQIVNTSISGTNQNLYLDDIAITHSGTSGIATTLTWSGGLDDEDTVEKDDTDDDFTYSATKSNNSLGAITYTSSDESVATVNSAGKVHLVDHGTTTITATVAACGCYNGSSISYTLEVANTCADEPGTIGTEDLGCSGIKLTVTGHTTTASTSYQWYKDGGAVSDSTRSSFIAKEAGEYYVKVTNTCTLASTNTVTIEDASTADPTFFAKEFSVKDDHWFGYRLMQVNDDDVVTVKTAPTGWVELSDFKITTDANNIVSIEGNKNIASAADKTLTLTVTNECSGGGKDYNFSIHELIETAKPTIAWIATGTKGEKATVSADQSTNTALYKYLKDYYDLTPRNCYWTTREDSLVKEYSKYDLIILTDYPNSQTAPSGTGRSKSYTNAIGLLIDHKPILTFEAWVAGCPNWGIPTNPADTKTTQNDMTLLCNANDIFGTSDIFNAGADITVAKVASGQSLQGFGIESSPDFVFIGKITDSDSKQYVACCERQVNTDARMMVFGLNANVMDSITATGKQMVKGFANYLMLPSSASIPDCSVIFTGAISTDWHTASNWEGSSLPDPYASIRIDKPCVVDGNVARAGYVKIHQGGDFTGSLTITDDGAVIVQKSIYRIEDDDYTKQLPTEAGDIEIQSSSAGNGTLICENKNGKNAAIVEMYSKATYPVDGIATWQYIAVPFTNNNSAIHNYYDSWLYRWNEACTGWEVVRTGADVYPWIGYCITQRSAKKYVMDGMLVPTTEKKIVVPAGKEMVIGNSWTAPIQVKQFTDDDFGALEKKVYLFNTGTDSTATGTTQDEGVTDASRYAAGTYVVIPIHSASYSGDSLISSLQAFSVENKSGSSATLTLNYDRHVRPTRTTDKVNAGPMHAPRRHTEVTNEPVVLKIWASDSKYDDRLILLEREDFSLGYDDGWDGEKWPAADCYISPRLYSVMESGEEAITATPELEGTVIGFRAGEDDEYTLHFQYDSENEPLYLYDVVENTYSRILTGDSYIFQTSDKEAHHRFVLMRQAPQIATGTETTGDGEGVKAKKVLVNDKLYIILNGRVYSAEGVMVK